MSSHLTIQKGIRLRPPRVLLYGPPKIGKTTFASGAKDPVFIGNEDGADQVDVSKFPPPARWGELEQQIEYLLKEPHDYRTVVLDTLDWLEPMLMDHIVSMSRGATTINDGPLSYGKGKLRLVEEWRRLLARLERVRGIRNMTVIVLAHAHVKTFSNPSGEDYDRWCLKCNETTAGLFSEWVDVVGFAGLDQRIEDGKVVSEGERKLHLSRSAGWDAGSRYDLPSYLPLSWAALAAEIKKSFDDAKNTKPEAAEPPQEKEKEEDAIHTDQGSVQGPSDRPQTGTIDEQQGLSDAGIRDH